MRIPHLALLATALLLGLSGLSQAQTTAEKPTTKEAVTPSTVKQTVQPSSGMQDPMITSSNRAKPSATEASTSTTMKQTVKPSTGMADPSSMAQGKPTPKDATTPTTVKQSVDAASAPAGMAKPAKPMRDKKTSMSMPGKNDAQANAAVGSGSAGTVEGRIASSTNSNSKGER